MFLLSGKCGRKEFSIALLPFLARPAKLLDLIIL
jgi:hypothetical protein